MSNKHLIIIIVITFIVIVIWIIADILHTRPSIPLNPKMETLLTPINPNFDPKVISQIKEITPLTTEETLVAPAVPSATPLPSETILFATDSATTEGVLQ